MIMLDIEHLKLCQEFDTLKSVELTDNLPFYLLANE